MKLLYIGHFNNKDKWGINATRNVEALFNNSIEIVCRSILDKNNAETPEIIKNLQQNNLKNVTHLVQHVKLENVVGTQMFEKNILINENNFPIEKEYKEIISLMDNVWCRTYAGSFPYWRKNTNKSRVIEIPPLFNYTAFKEEPPEVSIDNQNHNYIFYTVMNYSLLKNLPDLLLAYYLNFSFNDNVSLIIKARSDEMDSKNLFDHISKMVDKIKREIGDKDFPPEVILTNDIDDKQIVGIHNYGDCFIDTSMDRGWDNNLFEAMLMNSRCITSNFCISELLQLNNTENYTILETIPVPALSRYKNPKQELFKPSVYELAFQMKNYYLEGKKTRGFCKNIEDSLNNGKIINYMIERLKND